MAIARSEPFREQACPLGVCDGSGWILGPEDIARPCECREERLKRGRVRGIASAIPPRYRGVSFERPPVSRHGPRMSTRHVVAAVHSFSEELRREPRSRTRHLADGRHRDRQDDPRDADRQIGARRRQHGRDLLHAEAAAQIRQTYQATDSEDAYEAFFKRLTSVDLLYIDDLGSERHTDWVVEQLYALVNERYENQRSMLVTSNAEGDVDKGQRSSRSRSARAPSRVWSRSAATPLPSSGTTAPTRRARSAQ